MKHVFFKGFHLCVMLIMLAYSALYAQEAPHISFIENKGQWQDNILYKSELKEGALFFEKKLITYAFVESEYLEKLAAAKRGEKNIKLDSLAWHYAYKVHFMDANETAHIEAQGEMSEYLNYYLGKDRSRWCSHVHKYTSICYKNIYDGVDVKYYENQGTYKYDVEISPEASVSQVKFQYEGAERIVVKNGELILRIGKFMVIENKPYAYQTNDNGQREEVACEFVQDENIISFKVGDYDKSRMLVIDPTIVFASYSSSVADNFGYTATYDKSGNVYGGGTVYGVGYPVTVGAYQSAFKGGSCDVGITKFNENGTTRIYSTYIGGNGADVPHSLYVSQNDELYVLMTTSSTDFPVTIGCYQNTLRGGAACRVTYINYYGNGSDIAISRLNASGTQLLSSTYFGGSANDGLNLMLAKNYADEIRGDLQVDASGNVYVASSTGSTDLPVTPAAIQSKNNGLQDGFVAKFSYDLKNLIYCSYLGGTGIDAIYNMELDANGCMYVCGGTKSTDFPVTGNAYRTTACGNEDGFVSKISPNGTLLLRSTYLGTAYTDQAFLVKLDDYEDVYVVGQTNDSASSWIYNVSWSQGTGQFLTKMDNDLSKILWSTSFGDANMGYELVPTAMMVDVCGRIHISGWGGSTNSQSPLSGMPITGDAFKVVPDMGSGDFYFITIDKDASDLVFASYYGGNCTAAGEHVDGGTSRYDRKGVIYQAVCAGCAGCNNFPVTPGVAGPTNNSTNCNMAVIKIAFPMEGVIADFDIPAIVCAPYSAVIQNQSQLRDTSHTIYRWDFGDGDTSMQVSPTHEYAQSGLYTIQLIVEDTGSCNVADTLEKVLLVLANRLDTLPTVKICKGDRAQIGIAPYADPNLVYRWEPSIGLNSTDVSNPYFFDTTGRTYRLYISNGYCTDTLEQKVELSSISSPQVYRDYACYGKPYNLVADTTDADCFVWSTSPLLTDTLNSSIHDPAYQYIAQTSKSFYVLRSNGVCEVLDTFRIGMSLYSAVLNDIDTLCYGDTIEICLQKTLARNSTTYTNYWRLNGNVVKQDSSRCISLFADTSQQLTVESVNEYGCKVYDTVDITVMNLQINPTVTPILCYGDSTGSIKLNVQGGSLPYSYEWNCTIDDTNEITNLSIGTYSVHVCEASGCCTDTLIHLTQPDSMQLSLYDTLSIINCESVCKGKVGVRVTGGVMPYSLWWATGDTAAFIDNLCTGVYTLYIADANNCKDTMQYEVVDTSNMEVTYSLEEPTCFGDCNGNIRLQVNHATFPCEYTWNVGNGNTDKRENLCAGDYSVLVKDAHYCQRQLFIRLSDPEPLRLESDVVVRPSCTGKNDAKIMVSMQGGTPPYAYYWNNVAGDTLHDSLSAGNYQLHVTDKNGCAFDTLFTILDFDTLLLTVYAGKTPCKEVCKGEAMVFATGGLPPYSYSWTNGDTSSKAENLCMGNYSVIVHDANNCEATISVDILDSSTFNQDIHAWADTNELYRSQSTMLHVTDLGNGYSYSWDPNDNLNPTKGTDVEATPQESTLYTVIVEDIYGCRKTDTVWIVVNDVLCEEPFVFVPNAFSPNGDGVNDVLYVRGDLLESIEFAVYDRWGEKLFETNTKLKGWDGSYKNKNCEPGVYVYYLHATCIGGVEYIHKGNVTLIR